LIPPTAVLAAIVGFSGAINRDTINNFTIAIPFARRPTGTSQAKPPVNNVASHQTTIDGQAEDQPKWIANGTSVEGDVSKVVLNSRLWSTEAEAIQDLQNQTTDLVRNDFEQRHPGLLDPKGAQYLKPDRIIECTVKQRHVEHAEHDFGTFSAPMYRAWWQIEMSPMVRTELYPEWKTAAIRNRILVVAVILGFLTLIAGFVDLYGTLKRMSNTNGLRPIAFCAMPVICWTAIELFIAMRLMS
jgi:hypothetical protein